MWFFKMEDSLLVASLLRRTTETGCPRELNMTDIRWGVSLLENLLVYDCAQKDHA